MAWYVLFVMTGYEHKVANIVSRHWRIDGLRPFVPMFDARFRKAGVVLSEKRRWIPGYVFLESEMSGLELYLKIKPYVSRTENALKLLRYGNGYMGSSFEMQEGDRAFLDKLLNEEHCVEMSQGYIKGTSIIVTEGPMIGLEGLIKKVNRHKMLATIEASIFGDIREITIGLEIISKIS